MQTIFYYSISGDFIQIDDVVECCIQHCGPISYTTKLQSQEVSVSSHSGAIVLNNTVINRNRLKWERATVDLMCFVRGLSHTNAQAIFDAHSFEASRHWSLGSSPLQFLESVFK